MLSFEPASEATGRRAARAAFAGLAAALLLGVFLPAFVPGLGDAVSLVVYVAVSLGIVAFALVRTHHIPLRAIPAELGMDRSPVVGLSWAFVVTVPMLIGFLFARQGVFFQEGALDIATQRPWAVLAAWAGAGLVEETLFRGYFFRQLVLRAGWSTERGIWVCGVTFGLLHIPAAWGRAPGEILAAVTVTAAGGAGFCWFLKEWQWNLWFVVGWHAFVNLWWTLGQGGESAAGGPLANVLRLGVVALTVAVTLNRHRLPQRWLGAPSELVQPPDNMQLTTARAAADPHIPTESDWRSEPWGIDTPKAHEHFFGKSHQEAVALFTEDALRHQEDLMFMPAACFSYYVRAYMAYLMSEDSKADSDGASCFFGLVEFRADDIRANGPLVSEVTECLEHLARHQDFYDADPSIYGNFPGRARRALSKVLCQEHDEA